MVAVALADPKARLSELIDRVAEGETVSITRREKAVARLVAGEAPKQPLDIEEIRRSRRCRSLMSIRRG